MCNKYLGIKIILNIYGQIYSFAQVFVDYCFLYIHTHSWFATVVDGNELGPVYPFQLKQLKYEDP